MEESKAQAGASTRLPFWFNSDPRCSLPPESVPVDGRQLTIEVTGVPDIGGEHMSTTTPTPEEATRSLHRAPDPNVVRVGPLYTCNPLQMVYPVTVSNQPDQVSEAFKNNNPALAQSGYNNLMLMSVHPGATLRYEW